jgi:SNF2 family DNA or RNA helicase
MGRIGEGKGLAVRVHATVVGNRIHVRAAAGLFIRALHERVPGANWSKTANAWTLPLSMDSARALRETFGEGLNILPPLWEWARDAVRREESLGEISRNLSAEGVVLNRVPEFATLQAAMANRPYQASAARFGADGRRVLIADTPGLGKTLEAIATVIESGQTGPYLVCAPQTSLDVVWRRELESRLLDGAAAFVVDGAKTARDRTLAEALDPGFDLSTTWVIINIEMLRTKSFWVCPKCGQEFLASDKPRSNVITCGHDPTKAKTRHEHRFPQLFGIDWGAIVMDECQRALIRTSGTPTQTRAGAKLLRSGPGGLRLALSGTPMRGKPYRLWGVLNWLLPELHTGFWGWVERYWHVDTSSGYREIGGLRRDREQYLFLSLRGVMIRRTKAEVSPELPAKQYMGSPLDPHDPDSPVAVWLPMTRPQERAYKDMAAMGAAKVDGGTLNAVGILAELTRLKQFASCYMDVSESARPALPSNKFDWLVQFLTERNIVDADEEPTGKVVVVSQFTQILELFDKELAKLGVSTKSITGRVTGRRRQEAVDAFNDPDSGYNVMLLNTMAGGVAITLDAADDMVFIDETHVPDDQEQTEDRINNRRPEEKVVTRRYWYLKSLGTVDEGIVLRNMEADREQKSILDGSRGVAHLERVFREVMK